MKPCKECPFVRSTPLIGAPDWLRDVLNAYRKNKFFYHSCHVTDPDADGYKGGVRRECHGHLMIQMNEMDKTPGRGGVYNSVMEMAEVYLRKWLGDSGFKKAEREFKNETMQRRQKTKDRPFYRSHEATFWDQVACGNRWIRTTGQ